MIYALKKMKDIKNKIVGKGHNMLFSGLFPLKWFVIDAGGFEAMDYTSAEIIKKFTS